MPAISNMKLRRRQVLRVLAGVVLVLLAAFATIFIRDALNMRSPENALPVMTVYHGNVEEGQALPALPAAHLMRNKYTWQFLFWQPVNGGGLDLEAWRNIVPAAVNPGSKLELGFSYEPQTVVVYRATGNLGSFEPLPSPDDLHAPTEPGTYTYQVIASWGLYRDVEYFFRIKVA